MVIIFIFITSILIIFILTEENLFFFPEKLVYVVEPEIIYGSTSYAEKAVSVTFRFF
jgi:hypothetical protein